MKLPDVALCVRLQSLYRAWAALHFASLYLWQLEMQLTVAERPGRFAIQLGWRGTDTWSSPCGEERAAAAFLRELAVRPGVRLCYGTAHQVAQVELPWGFRTASSYPVSGVTVNTKVSPSSA